MEEAEGLSPEQKLMEDLVAEGQLDLVVDPKWKIGDFVLAVTKARGIQSMRALAIKAELPRIFVARLISENAVFRERKGRQLGDERYAKIARALSINEPLFLKLITQLQSEDNFAKAKFQRSPATELAIRATRIRIMKVAGIEDLNAPDAAAIELAIESVLRDFVGEIHKF